MYTHIYIYWSIISFSYLCLFFLHWNIFAVWKSGLSLSLILFHVWAFSSAETQTFYPFTKTETCSAHFPQPLAFGNLQSHHLHHSSWICFSFPDCNELTARSNKLTWLLIRVRLINYDDLHSEKSLDFKRNSFIFVMLCRNVSRPKR